MGNLISDILLDKIKVDIFLFNGGNIWDMIEKGNIIRRDIVDVFFFSNIIVIKEFIGV